MIKNFAQVSELLESTVKDGQAKVKPADQMLMIPALFDVENPEKAKTHVKNSINISSFKPKKVTYKTLQKRPLNYLNIH